MGVCILPGARLGDGCVVGAGSVVAGELEPNSIAVGNPARAIRSR
jgi:virginiamycin A acetyltransferase